MPFGNLQDNLGEDLVLMDKANASERTQRLSTFMQQYEAKAKRWRARGNIVGKPLEGLLGAASFDAKFSKFIPTAGRYGTMPNTKPVWVEDSHIMDAAREAAVAIKDDPDFVMRLATVGATQSAVKVLGSVAENVYNVLPGDDSSTIGNDFSKYMLQAATPTASSDDALIGGRFGGAELAGKSAEERRVIINARAESIAGYNKETSLVRETLAPEYTSDTTWGDYADVLSNFIGIGLEKSLVKGTYDVVKASARAAQAAQKAAVLHPKAVGVLLGAGTIAAYSANDPDTADASGLSNIRNAINFVERAERAGETAINYTNLAEDMTARDYNLGLFERATKKLSDAFKDKGGSTGGVTTLKDVPAAVLKGLGYGLSPEELPALSNDILKGIPDPASTKAKHTIEITWDRDVQKDVTQTKSVTSGGIGRTAEAAGLDKKYIAKGEPIDEEMAVKEFKAFREATGMPAEIRVKDANGNLIKTLNPHVDHFMSASAIGIYSKKLREAGKSDLAEKIRKAVNTQANMLVYYGDANVSKGRLSPNVWKNKLKSKSPEFFSKVHGKGSYTSNKYIEAEKYWKDLFGDKEYEEFIGWYDNASLKSTSELFPVKAAVTKPKPKPNRIQIVED